MRIIFFFFQSVERHRMKLLNPYNQSIQVSNGYTINQTSFILNYLAKNSSFTQKKTFRGILFSQFVSLQHFGLCCFTLLSCSLYVKCISNYLLTNRYTKFQIY